MTMKPDPIMTAERLKDRCPLLLGDRWQTKLAKLIGVSDQNVRKWVSGRVDVPDYIDCILNALEALKFCGMLETWISQQPEDRRRKSRK